MALQNMLRIGIVQDAKLLWTKLISTAIAHLQSRQRPSMAARLVRQHKLPRLPAARALHRQSMCTMLLQASFLCWKSQMLAHAMERSAAGDVREATANLERTGQALDRQSTFCVCKFHAVQYFGPVQFLHFALQSRCFMC